MSSHLPAIALLYPTILTELRERMAVRATARCGVERAPGIVWLEPSLFRLYFGSYERAGGRRGVT